MSGILGEIAAAKSLAEDLYNFACRLKNARVDIGDLDVKLRNDRLLLLRYHSVLSQRLLLLRDHEIKHLRDYFQAISRVLLDCVRKIEKYEKQGLWGRPVWCVFGSEIQECEIKVAGWIGGLMSWAVVVDADQSTPSNIRHNALQCHPHLQNGSRNLRQAKSSNENKLGAFGQRRLLEHIDQAKASSGSIIPCQATTQFVNSDTADNAGSGISFNPAMTSELPQRNTKTPADEAVPDRIKTFKNLQLIGRGAFGSISKVDSMPLVVKTFRASDSESFRNEATVLKSLSHHQHNHIIQLISSWEEDGIYNMLLPLAQGDLRSLLMNIRPTLSNHTEQWLLTQTTGVADACTYIHSAGWHKDIKPENILLFHDPPGGCQLKVGDFGGGSFKMKRKGSPQEVSSSSRDSGKRNSMFLREGTHHYEPPEILANHYDFSLGDMWSLGCVLLEVLAWYLEPEGYSPQGFHHSRVQTIRDDGSTQEKSSESARFWAIDCRGRPILHPSVKQTLNDTKTLAQRSNWLLDVPYHIERLLSVNPENRFAASDLKQILQHSLALKKLALGDNQNPYTVLNGAPLPKGELTLDLPTEPTISGRMKHEETFQRQRVTVSRPLPFQEQSERSARNEKNQSLRKNRKWAQDEVRGRYLEP